MPFIRYPDLPATLLNADVNGTASVATLFSHNLWGLESNHHCAIYRPATALSLRINFAFQSTPMMCVSGDHTTAYHSDFVCF